MNLEWILSSCLLILAVLLLRKTLGGKISAGLRYALWLVVLLRLLVPVQLFTMEIEAAKPMIPEKLEEKTIYSIPIQRYPAVEAPDHGVHVTEQGKVIDTNSMGYVRLEDDEQTVVRYLDKLSALEVLEILWKVGAAVFAVLLLGSNLRFALRLRRMRRPAEESDCPLPLYRAEGLPSPCLFGVLRPAVYLTAEAAENGEMRRHVLAHELSHYRHGDHLWSILRCAALALHWWNPLVWLAVICSRRDGELACDERALKILGEERRAAYGETLLQLVTAKAKPGDLFSCATTMTGGKRSLRERIEWIACKRKVLVRTAAAVIALTLIATACSFGQVEQQPAADPAPTPSAGAPVVGQLPEPSTPGETANSGTDVQPTPTEPSQGAVGGDDPTEATRPETPAVTDRERADGDWAEAAYNVITEDIFYVWVETAEGTETDYAISAQNGSNVKHVGLYLPVSFDWREADESEWTALSREEQGTILLLGDWRGNEFQCASQSHLVRIRLDGEDHWFHVTDNDPLPGKGDTLFWFMRMLADDAASAEVWSVSADGDLDYTTAAQLLTEAVAENYRNVPDWVLWKPLDVQVFPVKNPVYDAYFGEDENFICEMPFLVSVADPMSGDASYWQSGAGLDGVPTEKNGLSYYEWGRTAVIRRNADGDWYIAERGTGGYTAVLPFHTYEATAQQLVETYFLTEGFSHDYLMFHCLYEGGADMLRELNGLFAERPVRETEEFFGGLYRHIKAHEHYGELSLEDVAALLEEPVKQYYVG